MARSFPPDVVILDSESLVHARLARGKSGPRIAQAKSYRLPADTFAPSVVTPDLVNEAALAEVVRRMKSETGKWEKVSLLLPDSWFRINLVDLPVFNDRASGSLESVRWSLKRTLPIPPEDLRIAFQVLSREGTAARLLVVSALQKTLTAIERVFTGAGISIILLEALGLSIWNAITVREADTAGDRLFLYVRDDEFTTAVFRGSQPLFIRSRNLSGERTIQQEIRLSASYLRDSLQAGGFENCYIAGSHIDSNVATVVREEFASPVHMISVHDFAEQAPSDMPAFDAELTACTGVFTG